MALGFFFTAITVVVMLSIFIIDPLTAADWDTRNDLDTNIDFNAEIREIENTIDAWAEASDNISRQFFEGCARKHGVASVKTVQVSLIETKQCLEDLYYKDLTRFGRILSSLPAVTEDTMISSPAPDVAMQDTVLWFCNSYLPNAEKCIQPFWVALKDCVEKAGDQDLEEMHSVGKAVADYICHNDGAWIVDLVQSRMVECLKQKNTKQRLLKCLKLREPLLEQLEMNHSIFSQANCRIHAESNDCILKVLEQCCVDCGNSSSTTPMVVDLAGGLIRTAMNRTNCQSFGSISGSASPRRFPNLFLHLILSVMLSQLHSV